MTFYHKRNVAPELASLPEEDVIEDVGDEPRLVELEIDGASPPLSQDGEVREGIVVLVAVTRLLS